MLVPEPENTYFERPEFVRYWSPKSENYAGGDVLMDLLDQGWEIGETIFYETFWHNSGRATDVYHMELMRDNDVMHISVLTNPYIRRFVRVMHFNMCAVEEQLLVH